MALVVMVIFKFEGINNPNSEKASAKLDAINEECETMRVAFDASECYIEEVLCVADEVIEPDNE